MSRKEPGCPMIAGIYQLNFAAQSLPVTHEFYTEVMGFAARPEMTYRRGDNTPYAMVVQTPAVFKDSHSTNIEIREAPDQASQQRGWDAVTWTVPSRHTLEEWVRWWDTKSVKHSRIFRSSLGWIAVAEDPDGRRVRLHTFEQHKWDDAPERDEEWLGE